MIAATFGLAICSIFQFVNLFSAARGYIVRAISSASGWLLLIFSLSMIVLANRDLARNSHEIVDLCEWKENLNIRIIKNMTLRDPDNAVLFVLSADCEHCNQIAMSMIDARQFDQFLKEKTVKYLIVAENSKYELAHLVITQEGVGTDIDFFPVKLKLKDGQIERCTKL